MKKTVILLAATLLGNLGLHAEPKPLKALLIAGGCCHDYAKQQEILSKGIQARAKVQVDVIWTDDKSTNPPLPVYDKADWAKGYDIIIHDECAASMNNKETLTRILDAHKTIPAVHLHCAMHSFRTGEDKWFKHLGLQSTGHGPQEPIAIIFVDKEHPITKPLADWTTIKEELYNNLNVFDAHPLAMGKQLVKQKDGTTKEVTSIVAWTNEKQGARSFSTTIGHNNDTVADARYLDLLTRGVLWACDKLNAEYLTPFTGQNQVTFVPAKPVEAPKPPPVPKDATGIKATASSEETGKDNFAWRSVDGDESTRWCASGPDYPQWLQLELEKPQTLTGIETTWENNGVYRYKVEASTDGKAWNTLADGSANEKPAPYAHDFAKADGIRFVKIHALSKTSGGWASIREVRLKGPGIKGVAPKLSDAQQKQQDKANDPYAKEGNIPPKIVELTRAQEDAILKDVKVSMGFRATLFASSAAANYPVYVAAAPHGDLYVSSDGNGSLGRNPKRGRVIRLRDLDNDGRADETKVFCEIDAPRGLVWDHDRLYLVHPPHLSEFIDADGDGVAEKQNILVKNIAFGYADRPADHTTNGLSLGMDGWLYIAGGDFGFMKAEGTDGRTLQHRGGGVIRVRPDGSGLEVYATGTRNILEVAISPQMDIFARDNTNDGGGWNVRFHHFTGMGEHGYPRLYKNFADECIAPLADYGGGSGCGAVYVDEPGYPAEWNNAPFTADWGAGAIYKHTVTPKGATFEEKEKPVPFVKMTRPTDGDVDAMGRFFAASWKGATFNWEGPDVGYIVCIKPDDFTPEPLPDFAKASDEELIKLLDSPSYRRRLEAQQTLRRRGSKVPNDYFSRIQGQMTPERAEIERMKRAVELRGDSACAYLCAQTQSKDPVYAHVATRVLATIGCYEEIFEWADRHSPPKTGVTRALAMNHVPEVVDGIIERLDKPVNDLALIGAKLYRQDLLAALCRLYNKEGEWKGDSWGTRPDTRGPYYQPETWSESPRILAKLKDILGKANPEEAAFLVKEMSRNRIQSDDSLNLILGLAQSNPKVIPDALIQLANAETIPATAVPLALSVVKALEGHTPSTVSNAIIVLTKTDSAEGVTATLAALDVLKKMPESGKDYEAATTAFFNSPKLENHHQLIEQMAEKHDGSTAIFADAALLSLASRKTGSPESIQLSQKALDVGWTDTKRRQQILKAIGLIKHQASAARVLAALDDADPEVKKAAEAAAKVMKLSKIEDTSPKIATLKPEDVLAAVLKEKGDPGLGEQVFSRATCVACHTVKETEAQKGPYLGNIAQTYKRPELAQNILDPNKTIAQGFASELVTLKDGTINMGFITLEGASEIKMRNIAAQEFTYKTGDIAKREKLPTSMMPPMLMANFTVKEFASLLDYLESLVKK
jgi:putative membrane-bound dehydrogenase-like protein